MPFWPKNRRWWRSRSISSPSSCYHYIAFSNPIPRQPAQPHRTECRQYWKVWVGDFGAWVVFRLDWYKCWEIRPIRYPIVHNSTELYSSLIEIIILIILIIIPNKNLPKSLPTLFLLLLHPVVLPSLLFSSSLFSGVRPPRWEFLFASS